MTIATKTLNRSAKIAALKLAIELHTKAPYYSSGRALDKAAYEYGVSYSQDEEADLLKKILETA